MFCSRKINVIDYKVLSQTSLGVLHYLHSVGTIQPLYNLNNSKTYLDLSILVKTCTTLL